MENKNWTGDTLAHNIKGNPEAPYINNTLIRHGARAVNYVNLIHPSEPNKIWEEAARISASQMAVQLRRIIKARPITW